MTEYIADGHSIAMTVEEGCVQGVVVCPGEGKCRAQYAHPSGARCALSDQAADAGFYDFAEWQQKPYRTAELPCEIEWFWYGEDEDSELFWRPVE